MPTRRPVDFFLVGAAKAGTTSIHRMLDSHPDVFMSNPKETNYFSREEVKSKALFNRYDVISTLAEYEELFSAATPEQITGEASVSYLCYPAMPERIFDYNREAKIIISLRDPVLRAISHHAMDVKLGLCKVDLERIFRSPDRYPEHFFQYFQYGRYFEPVRNYIARFGRDRVHIVQFQDLAESQANCAEDIFTFLGLSVAPSSNLSVKENVGHAPKNGLYRMLYRSHLVRSWAKRLIPDGQARAIKGQVLAPVKAQAVGEPLLNEMYDYYAGDLLALERLIGCRVPLSR